MSPLMQQFIKSFNKTIQEFGVNQLPFEKAALEIATIYQGVGIMANVMYELGKLTEEEGIELTKHIEIHINEITTKLITSLDKTTTH